VLLSTTDIFYFKVNEVEDMTCNDNNYSTSCFLQLSLHMLCDMSIKPIETYVWGLGKACNLTHSQMTRFQLAGVNIYLSCYMKDLRVKV